MDTMSIVAMTNALRLDTHTNVSLFDAGDKGWFGHVVIETKPEHPYDPTHHVFGVMIRRDGRVKAFHVYSYVEGWTAAERGAEMLASFGFDGLAALHELSDSKLADHDIMLLHACDRSEVGEWYDIENTVEGITR